MINKLKLVNHKRYHSLYYAVCLYKLNLNCYSINKIITDFEVYECELKSL